MRDGKKRQKECVRESDQRGTTTLTSSQQNETNNMFITNQNSYNIKLFLYFYWSMLAAKWKLKCV